MTTFADWKVLDCAECRLEPAAANLDVLELSECPHCGKRLAVHVFPAILDLEPKRPSADATIIGAESSCFYHAAKKATVICEGCGRFLCDLCDVEIEGRHLCTTCMEKATTRTVKPVAGTRYVHYDSIALAFALGGFVFWPTTFITASVALFYVFRRWRTTMSILPRNRWRFVVAGLVSAATLSVWGFFLLQLAGNVLS